MGVVNRVKKQRFHKLLGLVCNFWPQIPLVLCLLAASLEDWQQNCKTLLVNTTTATDQSRAQFAHNCVRARRTPRRAAAYCRTPPPHAARERQPLLHVGELEQLEKDLEKRRAPCVRVDGGGGGAAGVATPLLSGAARYLLWPPPQRRRTTRAAADRVCVRAISQRPLAMLRSHKGL